MIHFVFSNLFFFSKVKIKINTNFLIIYPCSHTLPYCIKLLTEKKNPMKMYIYNVPVDRHFFFIDRNFKTPSNCLKNYHDKCTINVSWNFDLKNPKSMLKITFQPMLGWIFQYALQLKVIHLTTQEHDTGVSIVGR